MADFPEELDRLAEWRRRRPEEGRQEKIRNLAHLGYTHVPAVRYAHRYA